MAVAMAVLVGCSGSGTDSGGGESGAGGGVGVAEPAGPGSPEAAPGEVEPDRQVVTTATASLAVEDPARAPGASASWRSPPAAGSTSGPSRRPPREGDGAAADLVVRVPSAALTGVLADLEDLGDVESVSVSRSDVTTTAVDLDARISALRTSVTRLQTLMDGAATTEALLAAEKALSERQEELESLQSRRALLADQVELSTLTVHLRPFGVAPPGGPDGFLDGLGTGWRALVSVLGAAVIALGVLLPWLAVGGLVTAAVLAVVRLARRRTAVPVPVPPAPPQG